MRISTLLLIAAVLFPPPGATGSVSGKDSRSDGPRPQGEHPRVATYSIVARDPLTGDFGVAVQSRYMAVGAVVPWAAANAGAVATQAFANPSYGPDGLRLLTQGRRAQEVVDSLVAGDPGRDERQLGVVDLEGNAAAWTGPKCLDYAGHRTGPGYTVQGNILAGAAVLEGMARAYDTSSGDFADRLLAALDAAERAGGDRRGKQSAALLIVREGGGFGGRGDRLVDLRVDDHRDPVRELRRLYELWNSTILLERRMETIANFNRNRQFAAAQEETRRVVDALNAELRDHPDDPEVLNRVAWILSTNNLARERALELAQRAAKLEPGALHIMDTLAECHYQLGQFDQAIAIASDLVAKDPGNEHYFNQLRKFREARRP